MRLLASKDRSRSSLLSVSYLFDAGSEGNTVTTAIKDPAIPRLFLMFFYLSRFKILELILLGSYIFDSFIGFLTSFNSQEESKREGKVLRVFSSGRWLPRNQGWLNFWETKLVTVRKSLHRSSGRNLPVKEFCYLRTGNWQPPFGYLAMMKPQKWTKEEMMVELGLSLNVLSFTLA